MHQNIFIKHLHPWHLIYHGWSTRRDSFQRTRKLRAGNYDCSSICLELAKIFKGHSSIYHDRAINRHLSNRLSRKISVALKRYWSSVNERGKMRISHELTTLRMSAQATIAGKPSQPLSKISSPPSALSQAMDHTKHLARCQMRVYKLFSTVSSRLMLTQTTKA